MLARQRTLLRMRLLAVVRAKHLKQTKADRRFAKWRLHAGELSKRVKMGVAGTQDKRMLQDECCNPHIVSRNGGTLLTQLPVNDGVMMRRLLVGIEDPDTGLQEKAPQDSLVARTLAAHSKAGAQFSQHDERQPDFIRQLDRLDDGCVAPAKIGVTVCVERHPQRHNSASIASCSARARSKAGSLCQVRAISLR